MYDYGTLENRIRYGRDSPPSYDLTKISVPINLHYGLNDWLVGVDVRLNAYMLQFWNRFFIFWTRVEILAIPSLRRTWRGFTVGWLIRWWLKFLIPRSIIWISSGPKTSGLYCTTTSSPCWKKPEFERSRAVIVTEENLLWYEHLFAIRNSCWKPFEQSHWLIKETCRYLYFYSILYYMFLSRSVTSW